MGINFEKKRNIGDFVRSSESKFRKTQWFPRARKKYESRVDFLCVIKKAISNTIFMPQYFQIQMQMIKQFKVDKKQNKN